MDTRTQARIFLADQRGCTETPGGTSCHTLNFGTYTAEGREPFGPLCRFSDETLRAGAGLEAKSGVNTEVVLLPVTGGLEYRDDQTAGFLESGQIGVFSLPAGRSYTVTNPYETETVQFLQLWFAHGSSGFEPGFSAVRFDLSQKNTLLLLFERPGDAPVRVLLGRFDGRREGSYLAAAGAQGTGVFLFVLQGVFEAANRLLHEKDGLGLWFDRDEVIEFEALSNDALVLLVEVPR
ncbi:pirin [Larkinella soli]|uniref:pirin n=1 Tax=Larkinella soli TaxID=1770527 RepID=UPI0019D04DA6|nr:pirin [Larkinella soli]